MVKEGEVRAQKYETKYDPAIIALRQKHLFKLYLRYAMNPLGEGAVIDRFAKHNILQYNLRAIKLASMVDMMRSLIWNYGKMSETEIEEIKKRWEEKGFPLEKFEIVKLFAENLSRFRMGTVCDGQAIERLSGVFPSRVKKPSSVLPSISLETSKVIERGAESIIAPQVSVEVEVS